MSRGGFTNKQRQAIYQREDQACGWCGKWAQGGSIQHRVARGMGGTRRKVTLADGVLLCGSGTTGCHGLVESEPAKAETYGYRLRQGCEAHRMPIFIHLMGWVYLTVDGGYAPARPPQDAA